MRVLKHVFFFVVQFAIVLACIVAGCTAYLLAQRGMPYADTVYFREDLDVIIRGALAATGVIFFVIICYKLTRSSLEAGDKDTDIPL